jgi:Bifunctional DNA primase/polymerase, N-terminal
MNTARTFRTISNNIARLGLWCFPIVFQFNGQGVTKRPLVRWKQYQAHPPTQREIKYWARTFGWASAAIPTGPATGLLVVDADSPQAIEWLARRGGTATWAVRTRHGLHLYYDWPAGLAARNSVGSLAPGIDLRGSGGCIVAPSSHYYRIVNKRVELFIYRWGVGRSPADLPRARPPAWLLDELSSRAARTTPSLVTPSRPYRGTMSAWSRKALDMNLQRLAGAARGTRNDTALRVAFRLGQLCGGGELSEEVLDLLLAIADQWTDERAKARDTIRRGFEAGRAHPKSAPSTPTIWSGS